jgi:hypothetical protein
MINPTKTLLSQKINRIDMKITQAEQSRSTSGQGSPYSI